MDAEVQQLITRAHDKAVDILKNDRVLLDKLTAYLMEKETIIGTEFMEMLRKEET